MRKPMKTIDKLVDYMKKKGIKFELCSEEDAIKHLESHNNYFQLTAYRKNYNKSTTGQNIGKYENLEFAYLVELARIDVEVRNILLQMALDIEHFLKVYLIKAVEEEMVKNGKEDGYKIVKDYLVGDGINSLVIKSAIVGKRNNKLNSILSNNKNPYCSDLISSIKGDIPIWAYVELISFGDIIDLIDYYSGKTGWTIGVDLKTIDRVRQLRNACAHGNCIINDLKSVRGIKNNKSFAPKYITDFLHSAGVTKSSMDKKMSNGRINQIVHLFYAYDKIVVSKVTRERRMDDLRNLFEIRFLKNEEYFKKNLTIKSTYEFFKKIYDFIIKDRG